MPLRHVLGERLGVPVFVDNDATVAALAEAHDEDLNLVARNLVIITVGTGIGGGIVIDGRIFRGASGGAGELGIRSSGLDLAGAVPAPMGHFPQPGSLEFVASGHALDRLAAQAAALHPDSELGRLARSASRCSAPMRSRRLATPIARRPGWSRSGPSGSGSASPTRSTRSTPKRS